MRAQLVVLCGLAAGVWGLPQPSREYCRRGSACWPDAAALAALNKALEPELHRQIKYDGGNATYPAPVPGGAQQPLFGYGEESLPALVVADEPTGPCFAANPANETRPTCLASTRNNEAQWGPAIVAFPLTTSHVVTAVRFAREHNLCLSVLGTGHDFMNRHDGCPDGFLIRTTLLKSIEWDMDDSRGEGGTVRVGSGHTFNEIARSASDRNRIVASGWTPTVGVAGWSLGGGHGPFNGWAGLGVDNFVEAEIVLANGTLITANETHNTDLHWALRGGGGSTWGVLTHLTLRAHTFPTTGFHERNAVWVGDACAASKAGLHRIIDEYLGWVLTLDNHWNGLVWMENKPGKALTCGATWTFMLNIVVTDSIAGSEATWKRLLSSISKKPVENAAIPYTRQDAIVGGNLGINVKPYMAPRKNTLGSLPSVMVGREMVANGQMAAVLKQSVADCNGLRPATSICEDIQLYNDVTGNHGATVPEGTTAVNPGFRSGMFHIISGSDGGWSPEQFSSFYALGNGSYFSESAHDMEGFHERYWGENYPRLLEVKRRYDPDNFLWCRNCVGSDQ